MTKTPMYVDVDDDGNEYTQPGKAWASTAGHKRLDLLHRAFMYCSYGNKKRFGAAWEARAWRQITKKLEKGSMPEGWVENCLAFVKEKNKDRVTIMFGILVSMILNIEKQKEWEAKVITDSVRDFIESENRDFSE